MSHMTPYNRMSHPNIGPSSGGPDLPPGPQTGNTGGAPNPKKRRKNANANNQPPAAMQDLLPPPLSGFGDTIVASNPFDDCPPSMSVNTRSPNNPMGMQMSMGQIICRPMGPVGHNLPPGNPGMVGQPMGGPMGPGVMGPHGPHPMPMPPGPMNGGMPPQGMMPRGTGMHVHGGMGPMGPMGGHPHGGMGGPPGNAPSPNLHGHMMNMGPNGMNQPMGGPVGPPMQGQYHCQHNNNFMMNPMSNMYPKPMPVSAGKIYPADQPMVFNAQNPNAPPIYPCGVCHKEVHDNDQAILCESGCNFWFHRGCTGLTEAAFQLLTQEVYAEWVCDKCLSSKNIPLVKFKP